MSNGPESEMTHDTESPPVFRKWRSWYILVISVMLVQLVVYLLISLSFS